MSTINLDELRSRNPLLPLAQRHMKLRRAGRTWIGCCPFHDEKTPSFTVYPDHRFHCFGCGAHGDVIDFVRRIDGLTFREARDRLVADGSLSPASPCWERTISGQDRTKSDHKAAVAKAKRIASCAGMPDGTPAETYLTDVRGIPAPIAGWPEAVGWHAGDRALVLAATNAAAEVRAVQWIMLGQDGRNRLRPDGKKIKLTAGRLAGATVRLPGLSVDGPLQLAEGSETGLSVWAATGHETWITLGRMGGAELPADKRRIMVVCADDDPPEHPAAIALAIAISGWRADGRKVAIARPWASPRGDKSDFNALIREAPLQCARQPSSAADLRREFGDRVAVTVVRKWPEKWPSSCVWPTTGRSRSDRADASQHNHHT
jgi:hypothetical protein